MVLSNRNRLLLVATRAFLHLTVPGEGGGVPKISALRCASRRASAAAAHWGGEFAAMASSSALKKGGGSVFRLELLRAAGVRDDRRGRAFSAEGGGEVSWGGGKRAYTNKQRP